MTLREREDHFIQECRRNLGTLTFEAELLLRHGFSTGARELSRVAYTSGQDDQRARVLDALGAASQKERSAAP